MNRATYILVCDVDATYTVLNRFDPKTSTFEGEYSLLHNCYSQDAYFLSRFLIDHCGHALVLLDSDSSRYSEIRNTYQHFGEDDIPKYVEEKVQQRAEIEHDLSVKQSVGQLQLLIAKKMLEKEWEAVQNKQSNSDRDTYVLLGQDWAFRWAVETINQVIEFGQRE